MQAVAAVPRPGSWELLVLRDRDEQHEGDCDDSDAGHGFFPLRSVASVSSVVLVTWGTVLRICFPGT